MKGDATAGRFMEPEQPLRGPNPGYWKVVTNVGAGTSWREGGAAPEPVSEAVVHPNRCIGFRNPASLKLGSLDGPISPGSEPIERALIVEPGRWHSAGCRRDIWCRYDTGG